MQPVQSVPLGTLYNASPSTSSGTTSKMPVHMHMSISPPKETGQFNLQVTKTAFLVHALVLVCKCLHIHDDANSDLVNGLQKEDGFTRANEQGAVSSGEEKDTVQVKENESALTNNQDAARTASYGEEEETALENSNGNKSSPSKRTVFFLHEGTLPSLQPNVLCKCCCNCPSILISK